MNILLAEKLSKTYGEKNLFTDLTFGIEKGQKLALIARNGTGKSTLLSIIGGTESPDSGQIVLRNDIRVSFLQQDPEFDPEASVLDLIFSSKNEVINLIRDYENCLLQIENSTDHSIPPELENITRMMDQLDVWNYESNIKQILDKFQIKDFNQKAKELSGGQKKKISLASALINESDLLILDEPTNHLDIDMIEWLEEYLKKPNLSLLMVTHDRYFLNRVCDEILELENGQLFRYKGKYEYYLEKKDERVENEKAETEKARSLYRKELDWMRKTPQARTTKSKSRIDSFYEIEEKAFKANSQEMKSFGVISERMGSKILEINNLHFSYENKKILHDFTYTVKRGERIGIVGPNGCGKSTLLKLIHGDLKPLSGKIAIGSSVQFGYYSQDGLEVDESLRLIDILKEHTEWIRLKNGREISASVFLTHFGFAHTTQWNYYNNLSGGEKRRFHLLLMLSKNPNFLLLDEPTNDFDIETMNTLEDFLLDFDGCVFIVSHDRFLLDKVCDHIFVFEENGNVKDFYSSYSQYRQSKKKELALQKKQPSSFTTETTEKKSVREPVIKRSYKEEVEYQTLEKEIETLEITSKQLLNQLNSGETDSKLLTDWAMEYEKTQNDIELKTNRWIELDEKNSSK